MKVSDSNRQFDVLLAGYYGFGNLGDELLAQASVDSLTALGVKRERIAILSAAVEDSEARFKIRAFDRWKLSSVLGSLSRSRSLLLGGGGLFQDASSARSCFYYWGLIRLARLRGCKVWALGQSVGPLEGGASRFLTRNALSCCSYLAVRDRASSELLGSMGIESVRMPDIVLGLSVPESGRNRGESVLINIRPVRSGCGSADAVIKAAQECVKSGRAIKCVALSREDERLMADRMERGELPRSEIVSAGSLADFASASEGAYGAIGMRLHFGVLAALCGLKVILSPYDPKVSGFAESSGIGLLDDGCKSIDASSMLKETDYPDRIFLSESRERIANCFKEGLKSL